MTLSFSKEILHPLSVIFLPWDKGRDNENLQAPAFVMIWGVCFKLVTAHRVEMTALGLISFPNCWLLQSPDTEGGTIPWHSCEVQGTEALQ